MCRSMRVSVTAGDEARPRDIDLGRVALYQLSYSRPGLTSMRADLLARHFLCCTSEAGRS
jgi:hypothetical protein